MTDTISSYDIRRHVVAMTVDGNYDVDAIVADIVAEHGRIDIGTIDARDGDAALGDAIWQIVWRHDLGERIVVLDPERLSYAGAQGLTERGHALAIMDSGKEVDTVDYAGDEDPQRCLANADAALNEAGYPRDEDWKERRDGASYAAVEVTW